MAQTQLLSRNFDGGYKSDIPRDELPPNVAYAMKDFLPRYGASLRGRGASSYATASLNDDTGGAATQAAGLCWGPFPTAALVTVDDAQNILIHQNYAASNGVAIGVTNQTNSTRTQPPFWHRDRIIIVAGRGFYFAPRKITWEGSPATYTVADVGGTPPLATVGASWGDYLLLANGQISSVNYINRLWFSDVGNPDGWTGVATSYWDFKDEIVALAPLGNKILVFGFADSWALTGDIPPPGGTLIESSLFLGNGCADARSIARFKNQVIWANEFGVWKTDGTYPTNLTELAGVSQDWQAAMYHFAPFLGDSCAGGVFNGYFIATVNSTTTGWTTFVFDLEREACFQFTNFHHVGYATQGGGWPNGAGRLFGAVGDAPRVEYLNEVWMTPSGGTDADGTVILPQLETPFYKLGSTGKKRLRRLYANYDVRTAGTAALQVGYVLTPEDTSYTTISSTLPSTTQRERKPLDIRKQSEGIGLKLAATGTPTDTQLHELEIDAHALEEAR